MKVLFITNIPSPYKMDFFEILSKNCELTVLFERADTGNRDSSWLRLKGSGFKTIYLPGVNVGDENALCFGAFRYIINHDYDIVVLGQYSSPTTLLVIPFLKLLRIPYYISTDGGMISADSGVKKRIKSYFMSGAKGYFSPSKVSDDFLTYYGAKTKIWRYPFTSVFEHEVLNENTSDTEKNEIRTELKIGENSVVLAVGQFIYRKGFDILLQCAKKMSNSTIGFYFVGGEATEEYIKLKNENHLNNVHFIGFKSKIELEKYYKMSDIFVLPTREDIWGLVVNEAIAHGLPVITTDHCNAGVEMIINGYNGYIVPIEDEDSIVTSINNILNDRELRDKMSKQALVTARRYTLEEMARCYTHAFQGDSL